MLGVVAASTPAITGDANHTLNHTRAVRPAGLLGGEGPSLHAVL